MHKILSTIPLYSMIIALFLLCGLSKADAQDQKKGADALWVLDYVVNIPDFPAKGLQFKSYSPLLKDPFAFKRAIQILANHYRDQSIDAIVGLDARGFIFGSVLAYELNLPFVLIRKAGKLPGETLSVSYELEYGSNRFEIEKNRIQADQKVLIVDDLIATGGAIKAAGELIERLGAKVQGAACLIELSALNGRTNVSYPVFSVVSITD